jgi:hypothetical protein
LINTAFDQHCFLINAASEHLLWTQLYRVHHRNDSMDESTPIRETADRGVEFSGHWVAKLTLEL